MKRALRANSESSEAIRPTFSPGTSSYATACPMWFCRLGLETRQRLPESGSISRWAASSLASGVCRTVNAWSCGFAGPGGSGRESTSESALRSPSISRSSRAQKKCWW